MPTIHVEYNLQSTVYSPQSTVYSLQQLSRKREINTLTQSFQHRGFVIVIVIAVGDHNKFPNSFPTLY